MYKIPNQQSVLFRKLANVLGCRGVIILAAFLFPTILFADPTNGGNNPKDTIKKKETVQPAYGFKDLFVPYNNLGSSNVAYNAQLNPQAVSFVQDYIRQQGAELRHMKDWGQPYFDLMGSVLAQYGIPKQLTYLAVIESHFKQGLVSWAGAVGPWQLMPETARQLGLVVNKYTDERTDYYKSTHAAAKYLKGLYNQLGGDWLLVIAAYNCGPGRILSAIKRSGSRSFWDLQYNIPTESRNHVKKFIGTHYIFEGGGGETTLTAAELLAAEQNAKLSPVPQRTVADAGAKTQSITGKFNAVVIAKNLAIDLTEFNRLNPGFDKAMSSGQSYNLTLPEEKMNRFLAQKNTILFESVQAMLNSNPTL